MLWDCSDSLMFFLIDSLPKLRELDIAVNCVIT